MRKQYSISDLACILGGGTPKTTNSAYWNGDIPWLSVVDFNNDFRHVYVTEKNITEEGLKNSSTQILFPGDIIISARGTVGALAQVGREMAFNQSCYGLRAKPEKTTNDYLYYLLKNSVATIKKQTHGSVFDTITRDSFDAITVTLPPLAEQKRIVALLSQLDDKIELNAQINHNLEEQAKAIFKSWFVDFEPFQDGKFVDSELGRIPQGWKVVELGTIASINTGKRPFVKQQIQDMQHPVPVIGASSVMAYTTNPLYSEKILVIGRVGTHGIVQRFESACWPSDNTLVITSKFHEFISVVLQQIDYKKLNRGSTQPLITQTDIKKTKIIHPGEDNLLSFEQCVGSLMEQWTHNRNENMSLAQLRDSLLPKLMSGKIDVSEVEI